MEYYSGIQKNEFMSFAGTYIKVETIILHKLTQEHKPNIVCSNSQVGVEQ